jgi:G:T-mismatch repair DNA endonuclease (very short patch repair protein)
MPRIILKDKRRFKAKQFQRDHIPVRGLKGWIDPFPNVHGTLPEKMVYAALSFRNIPFLFLNEQIYSIPEIDFVKEYQTDFIIPSLKIIIEVQGSHWHSMPKTIEADALKFAVYQQTGWRPLAWWDIDIIANVNLLFAADPVLSQFWVTRTGSTELPVISRKKQDTSKGIRTLNYKRGQRKQYKKKAPSYVRKQRGYVV